MDIFKGAALQLNERRQALGKWITKNPLRFLVLLAALATFTAVVVETSRADAMGFSDKTFWDWMDLLIVPIVLALGAYFFSQSQKRAELAVALDQRRHDTLQAYFDRMSELLLDGDLGNVQTEETEPGMHKRAMLAASVAEAWTVMALRSLDAERVAAVFTFLKYTQVGGQRLEDIVSLAGQDLGSVNWEDATLVRVDLRGAYLIGANLRRASLWDSRFDGAALVAANLQEAKLEAASLESTNLVNADLAGADLSMVNLAWADLTGAIVTTEQLLQAASLENATMPDGTNSDEWIKRHIRAQTGQPERSERGLGSRDAPKIHEDRGSG